MICNKVIIKGIIHVQVYYVACNCEQELREASADIPFTTVVNFDCINEDTMIRCRERVEYTDAKLEGEPCCTSRVRAVAILEICVCAFQTRDFMVVTNVCTDGPCKKPQPCAKPHPMPKPPKPEPKPEPPKEEVCPPGGYFYTVQAGDTLAKIAASFQEKVPGITWQQIARFNNIYAPYTLQIGQILRIPCVAGKG